MGDEEDECLEMAKTGVRVRVRDSKGAGKGQ